MSDVVFVFVFARACFVCDPVSLLGEVLPSHLIAHVSKQVAIWVLFWDPPT
jgi:hypothetical protein